MRVNDMIPNKVQQPIYRTFYEAISIVVLGHFGFRTMALTNGKLVIDKQVQMPKEDDMYYAQINHVQLRCRPGRLQLMIDDRLYIKEMIQYARALIASIGENPNLFACGINISRGITFVNVQDDIRFQQNNGDWFKHPELEEIRYSINNNVNIPSRIKNRNVIIKKGPEIYIEQNKKKYQWLISINNHCEITTLSDLDHIIFNVNAIINKSEDDIISLLK